MVRNGGVALRAASNDAVALPGAEFQMPVRPEIAKQVSEYDVLRIHVPFFERTISPGGGVLETLRES
jgi:hypothetical protein